MARPAVMIRAYPTGVAILLMVGLVGCAGTAAEDVVMPDVTGQRLDVAKSDIERAGFADDVEVLGGGVFGVVDESNWEVCEQSPSAGEVVTGTPRLTVDRSCGDESGEATEGSGAEETEPAAEAYTYEGPAYEIVAVDENVAAGLDQHWAYTVSLDTSTDDYRDQVKLMIEDVARAEGTDKLIVQVITDREIAEAESPSTTEAFVAEHGLDYFQTTIPEKEKTGWIAWYTGGIDLDTGDPSDDAFVIDWSVASDHPETETWRPDLSV